jgi:FtsZ-binding cell division protein ZapB
MKYKYIRLENIENYEGWDLVHIIPRISAEHYQMCVIGFDDTPQKEVESYIDTINRQKVEIECLKDEKNQLECDIVNERMNLEQLQAGFEIGIEEAIKYFAERLKAQRIKPEFPWDDFVVTEGTIDEVLKEMVGDTDV